MQYDMLNHKFHNIQRQFAWAPNNTSSSLPKRDFLDALTKSLPRCDILWHFWKRWGQNRCQTPTTSPWQNHPSKKTIDMYDVLFDSLYHSELLNAKGCAQWKIELQLFGKGGSVIVGARETRNRRLAFSWPPRCTSPFHITSQVFRLCVYRNHRVGSTVTVQWVPPWPHNHRDLVAN